LIRGHEPTASKYLVDAMNANEKIEIMLNTDLIDVKGKTTLEQIVIKQKNEEEQTFDASALFVFIGVQPQSTVVSGLVICSNKGYILTGADLLVDRNPPQGWTLERLPMLLETSTPGIFAAGDVRLGTNHRVASAAGEGAMAYALIKEYLKAL
jgi:thioredoxin reductase (NADPH)